MNKKGVKWASPAIAALMLFTSYGTAFGAETGPATGGAKSDIQGHWAENQITDWMNRGLVKGYSDGNFKPNGQITRGEFFALINRSFGFTEKATVKFGDLAENSWAYDEVAKAVKAGYVSGYADGNIGASAPISRQEAAVIVARLLDLHSEAAGTSYTDAASFAGWAKEAIAAVSAADIMRGTSGRFSPGTLITRAEAVVTLDRASHAKVTAQASRTYDTAGTYGPESGTETVAGSVAVNAADVTLKNMVIEGDLILGEGIGTGDAFLEGVTVKGRVLVHGGGENSIHFKDSVLVDVIVDKATGLGTVRIVSEGTTTVALVIVNSPTVIKESGSAAGFGNVNVSSSLPAGSKVTLQGSFDTLNVSAKQIQVDLPEGSVQKLNAAAGASDLTLNLNAGTKVNSLVLDAIVKVLGQGVIVAAVMNTGGSTFQTPPQTSSGNGAPAPTPAPVTPPSTSTPSNPTTPPAPAVDKKGLAADIENAKKLLAAHPIGNANGKVYENDYEAYEQAIDKANQVNLSAAATQAQVDAARTALTSATNAFSKAIIVVSTQALDQAIASAQQQLKDHPVGEKVGYTTQAAHDAFAIAIANAQAAAQNPDRTSAQVKDAEAALSEATRIFSDSFVNLVDRGPINQKLAEAFTLLNSTAVGTAAEQVPQSAWDTLSALIDNTNTQIQVRNVKQAQIDAAVITLSEAIQTFQAQIIKVDLQVDSSASSVLPILKVSKLPAGLKTIEVYEGDKLIATGSTQESSLALMADYLAPGSHTLQVKVLRENFAALSSDPISYTAIRPEIQPQNQISAGSLHAAMLTRTGAVYTWGYNNAGQIGDGTTDPHPAIFAVPGLPTGIISVQAGFDHTLVLTEDGQVWRWGRGGAVTPSKVEGLDHIVSISSEGGTDSLALRSDGTVWKLVPYQPLYQVEGLDHVKQLQGRYAAFYALKTDGTVWAWGYNADGELGNGSTVDSNVPTQVKDLPAIKEIRGGNMHMVALSEAGDVYTWGYNANGEIGDGTADNRLTPYKVKSLSNIKLIGTGAYHTFAQTTDGRLYVWGYNGDGQLGLGNDAEQFEPTLIDYDANQLSHLVAISGGGGNSTYALFDDGRVMSWGSDYDNLLGDDVEPDRSRSTLGAFIPGLNLFTIER